MGTGARVAWLRIDPLSGTTGSGKVRITRDCRGQGQTACKSQIFSGTISASGKVSGSWVDPDNGLSGTWMMAGKAAAVPSLAVSLSAPRGLYAVQLGEVFDITVEVTASGADFKDVFLTNGGVVVTPACLSGTNRKSSGNAVIVTYAPPTASGFPLDEGTSRTFVFKARGHSGGRATLSATAHGETLAGKTAQDADSAVVDVESKLNLPTAGKPVNDPGSHLCTRGQPVNPPGP